MKSGPKNPTRKQVVKATFGCGPPVEDGVEDAAHFEQCLQKRIKFIAKLIILLKIL